MTRRGNISRALLALEGPHPFQQVRPSNYISICDAQTSYNLSHRVKAVPRPQITFSPPTNSINLSATDSGST